MLYKNFILALATLAALAGCSPSATGGTMSNEIQDLSDRGIAESDRKRLAANAARLALVARTACNDGYVMEMYAPPELSWREVLNDTANTSHRALFWVIRVPKSPPHATLTVTLPLAVDRPEWFAEQAVNRKWQKVPKPPGMGSAHESLKDAPLTLKQSDTNGDLVLPTSLSTPVARVLGNPTPGRYRIHFPAFTAKIGSKTCTLTPAMWEVVLR